MYNTKFCKITHLQQYNAILCEWKQFCKGDDYRNPIRYGAELINKHNVTTWITDTTNGFESAEVDTKWLLEEFMPQMIESSVKKITFIIKNDSPLMDEIAGLVRPLSKYFEVELVGNMEMAIEFKMDI